MQARSNFIGPSPVPRSWLVRTPIVQDIPTNCIQQPTIHTQEEQPPWLRALVRSLGLGFSVGYYDLPHLRRWPQGLQPTAGQYTLKVQQYSPISCIIPRV